MSGHWGWRDGLYAYRPDIHTGDCVDGCSFVRCPCSCHVKGDTGE